MTLHFCLIALANHAEYTTTILIIKTHDSESRGQEEAQQRDH